MPLSGEFPLGVPLKVLIVEDNTIEAEREIDELRRAGLSVQALVVVRESELRDALAEFRPDVILCDFLLPGFDGMSALAIVQAAAPSTPIIFVSGAIGEERAAAAARTGVADYVLKSNLLRLPDAVVRAVKAARDKARRRTAEAELLSAGHRLTALLENVDSALASYSIVESRFFYLSPAVERVYGRPFADFDRDEADWDAFVHPDDRTGFFAARAQLMSEGSVHIQYRTIHPDGSNRWVNHRAKVAYDAGGTPMRIDSIGTDVTARMEQQRQLERVSRIRDVQSAVNSAIVRLHEPADLCREACRIATTIGGLQVAAVLILDNEAGTGTLQALVGDVARSMLDEAVREALLDPERARGVLAESLRTGRPTVENVITDTHEQSRRRLLHAAGVRAVASFPFTIDDAHRGAFVLASYEPGFFSEDEVELVAALTGNLAFALELAAKRNRLDYLAYYDPLTELPNRTLAVDRLGQEIAATARRHNQLALLIFDIRQFDYLNTTEGATSGDLVLRTIADRLRRNVGSTRIARVGGDRFAILIPELTALRDVMRALGPDGLALLSEPLTIGEREVRLTAHVGCAVYPTDGDDAQTIFRNAEAALQSAKTDDAPYRFYSRELNARLGQRLELEGRLRRASDENQFVLHYQPKVDFVSRKIVGVEALIRWRDPKRRGELVRPAEFIPVLEESGLIRDVGRWAMSEAAQQYRAWNDAGLVAPRIAVNISPVQLGSDEFLADVAGALYAMEGSSGLELEVTETALMANVNDAIDTLSLIRDLGVEIAIDDFGTGYSSLSRILQLPISTLKIDRSFISEMTTEANKMTLVSAMISLAHELKLSVVAEGVETEEQAALLRLLRCDQMQGFLVAKPLHADDLSRLLPARNGALAS